MVQHSRHPETVIFIKNGGVTQQTDVQFNNFEDGDTHCLIANTEHIRGGEIVIKHYLYPNQNEQIVRLLFLVEALRDMGARHVTAFVPYLPYARQDKLHTGGEVAAARLLCRLFKKSGIDVLYNIDNHFLKGAPSAIVEGLIIKNILIQKYLVEHLESKFGVMDYQMVGPDSGAAYLTSGNTMEKRRANAYTQSSGGSISNNIETLEYAHLQLVSDTIVVADDMVSTGGTMIMALQNLRERGVRSLYAITSHGLFLKNSFEDISSRTDGCIFSDTIPLEGAIPVVDRVFESIITEIITSEIIQ